MSLSYQIMHKKVFKNKLPKKYLNTKATVFIKNQFI